MADSTVTDVTKMKVTELRKELKSRGLSYNGDKAELVARLQAAIQDDHNDITLDSDEIDSDTMLEDDDKSQTDILDEAAAETLNDELALADQQPTAAREVENKPQKMLKRKIEKRNSKETVDDLKQEESKEPGAKKIVLNRSLSVSSASKADIAENKETDSNNTTVKEKIKVTVDADDPLKKMEMRAKRFGLPLKMTEAERKEARKQRFGQVQNTSTMSNTTNKTSLAENLDKLKKRAERFGQSVSKIMTDIENKEKLEKRKAKFNAGE